MTSSMYGDRADLYEKLYQFKDYASETRVLRSVLRSAGVDDGAKVVEGACGTGSYLKHLRAHYQVAGFDLSEGMVAAARAKLPEVHVWQADLADFDLEPQADAFFCLFGSIGYVPPERLEGVAQCAYRALRGGGVALIETWITPESSRPGLPSLQTWDGTKANPPESLHLARATTHLPEGNKSVFDFHWLVATPAGVEHFVDRHELWMRTEAEFRYDFEAAGFEVQWIAPGPLTGRPLLLARTPLG
jgi:SAM-dependent methyltransferase